MFSTDQDNNLHTLRLTVNATLNNNNTSLRCHTVFNRRGSTATTSDVAILQVVRGIIYLTMHLLVLFISIPPLKLGNRVNTMFTELKSVHYIIDYCTTSSNNISVLHMYLL